MSDIRSDKAVNELKSTMITSAADEIFLVKNVPIITHYFKVFNILTKNKTQYIKEDYELTQILLPFNKIDTIIDWYNDTIRFENDIPKTFNEGYIILENKFINKDYDKYRKLIRLIAEWSKSSFYTVKDLFIDGFLNATFKTGIHFKFLPGNKVHLDIYDCDTSELLHILNFEYGVSGVEAELKDTDSEELFKAIDDPTKMNSLYDNILSKFYSAIFVTIMWYIATNTSKTKYIYTQTKPKYNHEVKNVIDPKDVKTITTTIYDLSKVKTVNIDTLNRRKAGWTYSHSFEVHGHYRHYKNGKVIFINPFVKGKEKPIKSQKIVLNPKEANND